MPFAQTRHERSSDAANSRYAPTSSRGTTTYTDQSYTSTLSTTVATSATSACNLRWTLLLPSSPHTAWRTQASLRDSACEVASTELPSTSQSLSRARTTWPSASCPTDHQPTRTPPRDQLIQTKRSPHPGRRPRRCPRCCAIVMDAIYTRNLFCKIHHK